MRKKESGLLDKIKSAVGLGNKNGSTPSGEKEERQEPTVIVDTPTTPTSPKQGRRVTFGMDVVDNEKKLLEEQPTSELVKALKQLAEMNHTLNNPPPSVALPTPPSPERMHIPKLLLDTLSTPGSSKNAGDASPHYQTMVNQSPHKQGGIGK